MPTPNALFRALADPTRRSILELLRGGPMSSGDIAEHFPVAWATVSRHLGVLRDAGLIIAERDGTTIQYELNTTVVQSVIEHLISWTHTTGGRDA
jgi:DNA-binding transcriptional ArsR family regulator